jgi:transposase InsO family protein
MNRIELNTTLHLTDGDFLVVAVHGSMYKLYNIDTGTYENVHSMLIGPRLVEAPTRVQTDPRKLDTLQDDEREDLTFWATHLTEMETGFKNPATRTGEANPDYAVDVKMADRVDAKIKELSALGYQVSASTLYRKRRKFLDGGASGLIDQRTTRNETPLDRADERWVTALKEAIANQTNGSTRTAGGLLAIARRRLKDLYPGEVIETGSRATQYRQFNYLANGKYTTGTAKQRRERDNSPKRPFGDTRKYTPGEIVEIDSTPLDVLVADDEGNITRPILTAMVDVCTGTLVAHSFRLVAAKAVDHAFLLAQALCPRPARPGANEQWRMTMRRFAWADLVSIEEREKLDTSRPFIVPSAITVDHGTDYTGTVFESACNKFGIDLLYSAPGTPTNKPHVERFFRTVKDGFVQYFLDFTGGTAGNRGIDDRDSSKIDLMVLDQLFDEWITRVYQNRPSDSLIDPFHPGVQLSPNEMYAATYDLKGKPPVPIDAVDYISLLPVYERTVTPNGIQFNNKFYDSVGLFKLRMAPTRVDSNGRPTNKVPFRANPYDVRAIWVEDPDGGWIECLWRHEGVTAEPHSTAIAAEARRIVRESTERRDDHHFEDLTLEILSKTSTAMIAASKERARATAAEKLNSINGTPFHEPDLAVPTVPDLTVQTATADEGAPSEDFDDIDYFEAPDI